MSTSCGREQQRVFAGSGMHIEMLFDRGEQVRWYRHVADTSVALGCADNKLTLHMNNSATNFDTAVVEVNIVAS